MEKCQLKKNSLPGRTIWSFWPFVLWILPFAAVYGFGTLGYPHICDKKWNEMIAMPLVSISIVTYGLLAWKKRNEFAMVLTILSLGFFAREWHFTGTDKGVYVVIAIVFGWFVYRRDVMRALIKNTPVEIWLWATGLCYLMAQLLARRVFAQNHLGLLPMDGIYYISFEETMETMAHIMLSITSFVAWRQFGTANSKGKNNEQ